MKSIAFAGNWRIVEIDAWDVGDLGLLGPAYISFRKDKTGEFQFVAIVGTTDCRYSERAGRPFVEFTWDGNDESDHITGRGWAVIEMDGAPQRTHLHPRWRRLGVRGRA